RSGDRRRDNGNSSDDQIGHHCRRAFISTLEPVILDRNVLALDVASFAEALSKCGRTRHRGIGCPKVDKSNHRQRCLLRARHEWPCAYNAPEKGNEVAPPHFALSEASGRSIVALQQTPVKGRPVSALGQKQTCASQTCPLYPDCVF